MTLWRKLLSHFRPESDLPRESRQLHQEAQAVLRVLRQGEIRIAVVSRDARALKALRDLEAHARR